MFLWEKGQTGSSGLDSRRGSIPHPRNEDKNTTPPIQFTGLLEGGDETMPGKRSYKCLLLSDMLIRELREVTQLVRSLSPNTAGPVFLPPHWQGYLVAVFEVVDENVVDSTQTQKE